MLLSTGPLVTGASELSVGRRTVCAHLPGASDPSVCWGTFESGRVGAGLSGRFTGLATAVPIPATFDAGRYALGEAHACWVDASGDRVGCVGAAAEDRLGRSDCPGPTCDTLPATADGVLVTGLSELALGRQHSCAASPTELVCWGSNALGQLGADTSDPIVRHPGAFAALDSGTNHGCAVLDGTTRCWGSNDRLQAGPGGPVIRTLGTPGIMIGSPTLIAAGHSHTCASNGVSVECWGANDQGQLGSGRTDAPHASSEDVVFPQAPDAILSLDAGDDFTCAVATIAGMSEVYCWGRGSSGRLGSGRQILYPTPQRLD